MNEVKYWKSTRYTTNESGQLEVLSVDVTTEIERLESENEVLKMGMSGDYDLDSWLNWVKESKQIKSKLKLMAELVVQVGDPMFSKACDCGQNRLTEWHVKGDPAGCKYLPIMQMAESLIND